MQPTRSGLILCCLAALIVLLGGCALPGVRPGAQRVPAENPLVTQARAVEKTGDHARAAALFAEAARQSGPKERAIYSLAAAESLLMAGQIGEATRVLSGVDTARLDRGGLVRTRILTARLALAAGKPAEAASSIGPPPALDLGAELQRAYYSTQADARRSSGNPLGSSRALVDLDRWLQDPQARRDNQLAIIRLLAALPESQLQSVLGTAEGEYAGWVELALLLRQHATDPQALRASLEAWKLKYPKHPADRELLGQYVDRLAGALQYPHQVAVLLPSNGQYAEVAGALSDGLLAAYYHQPQGSRPLLRFYNTSDTQSILPQLHRAVQDGADFVLGPLQKEGVTELAHAGALPVPVLALNSVDLAAPPPSRLFQYGLPPEDEARLVAERAWLDGARRALALTPAGAWGERLLGAFSERFRQLGGTVVGQAVYDPAENDFSETLRKLLNLNESEERHRRLERLLGQRLEFEPRRRQDAEFLFLGANVASARKIRPQLQFHRAADLPVYATSSVYSGSPDPQNDLDLEGVRFPDMPWLLLDQPGDPLSHSALLGMLPRCRGALARICAMGMDSFRLIPQLARLQLSPAESIEGSTGVLWMDSLRQVHRRLPWARFRQGVLQVLGYPAASALPAIPLPAAAPPATQAPPGPPGPAART
jgi:hypothetical protein